MKIFLRLATLSAALIVSVSASAQTIDGPVGVAVTIKALDILWRPSSEGALHLDIDSLGGPQSTAAFPYDAESSQLTVRLEPGKTYFLSVAPEHVNSLTIQAAPPPGYVMEINRVVRQRLRVGGAPSKVRLRVRAPAQEFSGRAGTATALTSGRIFWQAALGSLANGGSAGALAIIDVGTSTTSWAQLFSPAGFVYEHASSEVEVIYNPDPAPSPYIAGTIRQIIAPEACADIVVTSATQAEVKFFHRDQLLLTPSTGIRSFRGSPFAWYLINQDGSTPNRAYINCDIRDLPDYDNGAAPLAKVKHTVIERTGTAPNFTWTADEWYDDGATSVSRDVRTRSNGVETITVSNPQPGGTTAIASSRTYGSVPWGEEIVSETRGTTASVTTNYEFYTASTESGSFGRRRSASSTGGGWEAFEYYDYSSGADVAGALHKRHRPFKNSDTSVPVNLGAHGGEVTRFEYSADAFGRRTRPALVETTVNGTVTARSTTSYAESDFGVTGRSLYLVTATRSDSSAEGAVLSTVIKYFREDAGVNSGYPTDDFFRNLTHSIQHPDGRKVSFVYQRGAWNGGSSFDLSGQGGTDYGAASRISIISGVAGSGYTMHGDYNIDDLSLVDGQSTMEVTIRDKYARIARTESHVWKNSIWNLVSAIDHGYNLVNQLASRTASNGALYNCSWTGERKVSETDETGVTVTYNEYDAAGRVRDVTREAGGSIGAVTTRYTYNAAHQVTESRAGWGLSENLVTSRAYDAAGRLISETPPGLGETTFNYNPSVRTRTTNLPGGGAITSTFYADGQLASVTGSATVEQHYTYEVQPAGVRYARVNTGSSGSARLSESWSDWLGRTTKTSRPGWPGKPAFIADYVYEAGTGRLLKTTATGYAPTRYEYNSMGQLVRSGLDIGDDGLNPASADRITDFNQFFENADSAWWLREETKIYPDNNSTGQTVSIARTRLTGHPANRLSEARVTDAEGNISVSTVDVNRGTKTVTVTATHPGLNNQTTTIVNGFATSSTGPDGLTYSTQYDSLLRPQSVTDPRIGATTTAYHPGSGLPSSVTAAAGLLYSCGYDGLGRKILHTDAAAKNTRYEYNHRSQLLRQWGDGAYPVQYGYDSTSGDRTSLSTYQEAPASDSALWPTNIGAANTTTFEYNAETGLLFKKIDAAANFVEFEYNERGQTYKRYWKRLHNGERITSTYNYDNNTGELTSIGYNDGTPGVGFAYTRLGQLRTANDSVTGLRTLNYDSGKAWRLDNVTLDSFYGSRVMTALYETSGVVGRARGFQLGTSANSSSEIEQSYGIGATGRLDTLNTHRSNNSVSRAFRYGYLPSSSLVETLTIDGNTLFNVTRGYEPTRDVMTVIDSKWNGASITRYDYTYNNLYQRDTAKQSGSAFADYGDATFTRYTYNPRGELTAAPSYLGSIVTDLSKPLPGRQHAFEYDSIGNRKWSNRTPSTATREDYGRNSLNQYSEKENHAVSVQGTVDSASTPVAVVNPAGQVVLPERQGRFWSAELSVTNTAAPWIGDIKSHAAKPGAGTGGADLIKTITSEKAQLAKLAQSFAYDADGNMTSDGIWDYQYDAENRLIAAQATTAAVSATFTNRRVEFRYDYQGRRVQKKVSVWNPASGIWSLQSERRFLYDGWNLIAEYSYDSQLSTLSLLRSYTWGLDAGGSLSKTGGAGALLQIHDHSGAGKTLLPTYDSNGNVVALLNESGGIEAAYEYSPFGELLRAEGAYAKANPFRFSTKFHDDETGLVYYGHRYYSPSLGRFINRDPIEESGGLNLYGFVANNTINSWDVLGLTTDEDRRIKNPDSSGHGGHSSSGSKSQNEFNREAFNPRYGEGSGPSGFLAMAMQPLGMNHKGFPDGPGVGLTAMPSDTPVVTNPIDSGGASDNLDIGTVTSPVPTHKIYQDLSPDQQFAMRRALVDFYFRQMTGIPEGLEITLSDRINEFPALVIADAHAWWDVMSPAEIAFELMFLGRRGKVASHPQVQVRSPNAVMRENANVRGNYVDPVTGQVVSANARLAADHIVPKHWIKQQPGFEKLTPQQQSWLLNHPLNTQGLPGTYNASKGAKMPGEWQTYKGQPLNPDYVHNDATRADFMKKWITDQIRIFNGQ